jgi:hypothetical protein
MSLACGLLIVTLTFAGMATAMRRVPVPFPADTMTAGVDVPAGVRGDCDARLRLIGDIDAALEASPWIQQHALVSVLPGRGGGRLAVTLPDSLLPDQRIATGLMAVTPAFFDLAGTAAARGRVLRRGDDERRAPVAGPEASRNSRHGR